MTADCSLIDFNNIELKTIKELIEKERKKISEEGILNFGIDTIVNKYFQIYSSINN